MSKVSTSAGRAPDLRRSIPTLRSTTSGVTSVPLASSLVSSSNSSPMTAASLADPVTVISFPRTWMSESNASSITCSNSSREPSRLTIECGSGITMRSEVSPPEWSLGVFFTYPASSLTPASARRPGHGPAAKHVRVHVVDGLASVAAGVEDHAIAGVGDAFRDRYLVCLRRDLREQARVSGDGSQVAVVFPRNHQYMNRRLRIYVAECERARAFAHHGGGNLTGRDSAE